MMKLSTRLTSSFVVVFIITALLGAFALRQLSAVYVVGRRIASIELPSTRVSSAMDAELSDLRKDELEEVLSRSARERAAYDGEMQADLAAFQRNDSLYQPYVDTREEVAINKTFESAFTRYLALHAQIVALARRGMADSAMALVRGVSREPYDRANEALDGLIAASVQSGRDSTARAERTYGLARRVVIASLAAALLASIILGWLVMRSIRAPLGRMVDAAERIGAGDLSRRVVVSTHDEIGRLASAFNAMVEKLGRSQDDLADLNHSLEARVAARTAELVAARCRERG